MSGGLAADGLTRLHEMMAVRVERGELPGAVLLVARGDEVWVDCIGSYGFEDATPMRRDTLFRIASLTKPVVAAATMMLVQDGALDLAEPVDRLVPELADRRVLAQLDGPLDETVPAKRPITVEDVLTYRMGFGLITEPAFNPPYPIVAVPDELGLTLAQPDPRTTLSPDEWIRVFGTLPLMDQPGERWRYNASGLVLGVLVARAAKAPLEEVLADRIFRPLGMVDTGFSTSPDQTYRIPGYFVGDFQGGHPLEQPSSPAAEWAAAPVFPSGSAGLLSTVDDYLAFARLLLNGGVHNGAQLLTPESVAALTTNHLTEKQRGTAGILLDPKGWGYGMSVAPVPDDVSPVPGRYGWAGGYGTLWCNDPNTGLAAVAFTQVSDIIFTASKEFFTLAVECGRSVAR
jgi:CubicO group peptidase (beta-lactamase class C family)